MGDQTAGPSAFLTVADTVARMSDATTPTATTTVDAPRRLPVTVASPPSASQHCIGAAGTAGIGVLASDPTTMPAPAVSGSTTTGWNRGRAKSDRQGSTRRLRWAAKKLRAGYSTLVPKAQSTRRPQHRPFTSQPPAPAATNPWVTERPSNTATPDLGPQSASQPAFISLSAAEATLGDTFELTVGLDSRAVAPPREETPPSQDTTVASTAQFSALMAEAFGQSAPSAVSASAQFSMLFSQAFGEPVLDEHLEAGAPAAQVAEPSWGVPTTEASSRIGHNGCTPPAVVAPENTQGVDLPNTTQEPNQGSEAPCAVAGSDTWQVVEQECRRVTERLRGISSAQVPGDVAAELHDNLQTVADRTADVEGGPDHQLPSLPARGLADQVIVLVEDALATEDPELLGWLADELTHIRRRLAAL